MQAMKENEFQLSPEFNQKIINLIKEKKFNHLNELKRLWQFSLFTAASAAILTVILLVYAPKDDLISDVDLTASVDEFELTIDYWSNN